MGAVAAATADVPRLYPLNTASAQMEKDASGKVAYPYGTFSASLGRGDSYTLDAREGLRWGRVVVQTFGKTATSALAKAEEARDVLVGLCLTITGYSTTPLRSELDPTVSRDPDDSGVVGATQTFTFTATKEA